MILEFIEEEEEYEDFNVRYCPFNFQPVCFGPSYGYFECPRNPEGCAYNSNDDNFANFERNLGINL